MSVSKLSQNYQQICQTIANVETEVAKSIEAHDPRIKEIVAEKFKVIGQQVQELSNLYDNLIEIDCQVLATTELASLQEEPDVKQIFIQSLVEQYQQDCKVLEENVGQMIDRTMNHMEDFEKRIQKNTVSAKPAQIDHAFLEKRKLRGDLEEPFFLCNTVYQNHVESLGIYDIPTIGFYGQEYRIETLMMSIKKSLTPEQMRFLPWYIQQQLRDSPGAQVEFYFSLGDATYVVQDKPKELNLLYHGWVFPDIQRGETRSTLIPMGIITEDSHGITSDSLSVDQLALREIVPHPSEGTGMCCSPNNARVTVNYDLPVNAFWAVAKNGNKIAVSFHCLVLQNQIEKDLNSCLHAAQNLNQAFEELAKVPAIHDLSGYQKAKNVLSSL